MGEADRFSLADRRCLHLSRNDGRRPHGERYGVPVPFGALPGAPSSGALPAGQTTRQNASARRSRPAAAQSARDILRQFWAVPWLRFARFSGLAIVVPVCPPDTAPLRQLPAVKSALLMPETSRLKKMYTFRESNFAGCRRFGRYAGLCGGSASRVSASFCSIRARSAAGATGFTR
jgi:hypothetical protein